MFDTNGTLLTIVPNPGPESGDRFGFSLCAVGTEVLMVGAFRNDFVALDAGTVYLFDTNATLLKIVQNPTPTRTIILG